MTDYSDPRLVKRLSIFASAAPVFSVVAGLLGLAGWKLHIATLSTWGIAPVRMVANTAAGFVLLGASLWILRKKDDQSVARSSRVAANVAAASAALVGLFSLAEQVFGWDLGIDQLLVLVSPAERVAGLRPGMMSLITALDFLLLGLALLLLDCRTRRHDWPAQFLCFAALVGAAFGFLALALEPNASRTSMALPTVVSFLVLTSGLVCSRPTWALGGLLTSPSPGARLLRRAVPAALLVLSLIGWAMSKALLTEFHFTWIEVSVLAIVCSAMLAGFIAWMAFIIDRSDAERKKVEEALHVSKEELDRLLGRIEEPRAEAVLRRRVAVGFAVAVLLTGLMGLLSWRNAQQAAEDAAWIAHTHEVMTTLEATFRHLDDVETGARGFALTGNEQFLQPYESGEYGVGHDLHALRLLVMDNPDQERRSNVLEEQAQARIEAAKDLVALRHNTGRVPPEAPVEREEQIMDATRTTVEQMEAEETRLLEERSHLARVAQHFTGSVIALGWLFGVVFLSIAGFTLSREIGISARARAQVEALNADLERRVAQRTEALGKSELRLAGVIQSAMDSIITVDERQNILMFNSAAEKMFRCRAAEALGQPLGRFVPQRLRAAHARHIRQFGETGVTARAMGALGALWAVRADGEEFQIEASISQVEAGGNKLFTVIMRDVTERVRAEASRSRLAAIVEYSDNAILSKDLSGIVSSWNKGAERLYGYRENEVLGEHINLVVPAELQTEEIEFLRQVAEGKTVHRDDTLRRRKDGKLVHVSLILSPLRDSSGKIIGASTIAHDLTELKEAESALRKQTESLAAHARDLAASQEEIHKLNESLEERVRHRTAELEAANKELEAFTYSVSHDLRAPLRHISGFSRILMEDFAPNLPEEAQRHLQRIEDGSHRMGLLVDELLSLARVGRQALDCRMCGLNSIVQEVIALLGPEAEGRQVEWKISELPFFDCDPALIKQVFQNLLSNALKYSRPRATAVIELGQVETNGERAVFVRDNGVGFSMKYADKLFGVFQRLHRAEDFEGTGVGLATVHRIIQKHGGRIWAEAELDKGATFYFTLGARAQEQQEQAAAAAGA